jgi:hypothetical protein
MNIFDSISKQSFLFVNLGNSWPENIHKVNESPADARRANKIK